MLRLKTKIAKRRVEIKLAKKKHNLIRCKCLECGKKKWSQYNKRSSKVICLTILNLIVWAVSIDGYTNWYASRGVWTFEAAAVRAQEKGQESIKDSAEAPIIDPSAVSKPTATVSENQRGNEYTHLPSSLSDIEAKIRLVFHEEPDIAEAVFMAESGLNPTKESDSDRMADGRAFSAGLAQINLTVSEIDGVDCTKAFSGRNYKAKVIDEKLYSKCLNLAKNPEKALLAARAKYENNGFNHWSVYLSGVYKKHM